METEGKKRGLGRGLSALLPGASGAPVSERVRTYFSAQIEDVYPAPDQPRRRFPDAELEQLASGGGAPRSAPGSTSFPW
jgi:ParB family chromosome partitioning protein